MQTRAVVYKERESGTGGDYELKETIITQNMDRVKRPFITYAESGGRLFECEEPDSHSVVVKVKACGLSSIKRLKFLKDFGLSHEKEKPVGREISGIVTSVGSSVTRVSVGDEMAGLVPANSASAGCATFCVVSEFDLVSKPEKIGHVDAAGCIGDGVRAYTALHYQAKLCGGETILVFDGASSSGLIMIQLAQSWGAKVITTASTEEEVLLLESLQPQLTKVIDFRKVESSLADICMEETGGLGIDCIVDNGVALYSEEFTEHLIESELDKVIGHQLGLPSKHDIISCLGVGGRWVTSQPDLQLDPPDSKLMFAKGASLCFLFEDVWTLSRGQQGRYLHILNDLMDKMVNALVRPVIHHTVSLDDATKALKKLKDSRVGKIVVTI